MDYETSKNVFQLTPADENIDNIEISPDGRIIACKSPRNGVSILVFRV